MRSILLRFFLFFILTLFLVGCCRHYYRGRPIALPCTDLSLNVNEAFCSSSFCPGFYPSDQWWLFFEDDQLTELIQLSLASHPDMKLAEARIRRACQYALEARAALYPHLFLFGNLKREKISKYGSEFIPGKPELFTETTLSMDATYELDIWGKNRSIFYAQLDKMQATIAEKEEAKLLLSTAVAESYFNLQCHLERLVIAREKLATLQGIYAILTPKFGQGVIAEFDLYETDSEIAEIQDEIAQIEGLIDLDQHALAALVGNAACDLSIYCIAPSARFHEPFPLPSTLPLDLLARRPDITAQKWRVEAACFEIKVAKTRFLPNIDLFSLLGVQSIILSKLFTGQSMMVLGEATGILPLFTGGKLCAELGVARETLEIAIEEYNQTILRAIQQVNDALTGLMTADKQMSATLRSLRDMEGILHLTNARYFNGIDDRLNLLYATENYLAQADIETQIQLARFQAAVGVIRAIGGGYYDCECK